MRLLGYLIGPLALVAAYLLFWPVPIDPAAWTPPPMPSDRHPYNEALKGIERLAEGVGRGPEGIAIDDAGRLYTGYDDGRVMSFDRDGGDPRLLADTGGRPLGLSFAPHGGLVVADAVQGLLLVDDSGVKTLSREADGLAFKFVDDVDRAHFDARVFFSDASSRFGIHEVMSDAFEHRPNGRLLEYDFDTGQTRVLLSGLYFANGVAVGPEDAYVLVSETTEYRIRRYWLKGEKAGTSDVFVDNLPGFPDNLSYDGEGRIWVALYAPRQSLLDALLPRPYLRKLVFRLPEFLHPAPVHHAWVLGFDLDGRLVADLQYRGDGAYAPITSVERAGEMLYMGSLTAAAIGRLPLAAVPQRATP